MMTIPKTVPLGLPLRAGKRCLRDCNRPVLQLQVLGRFAVRKEVECAQLVAMLSLHQLCLYADREPLMRRSAHVGTSLARLGLNCPTHLRSYNMATSLPSTLHKLRSVRAWQCFLITLESLNLMVQACVFVLRCNSSIKL